MQVLTYGIALSTDNEIVTLDDLFQSLHSQSGADDYSKGTLRRFYVDAKTDSEFYLGMVVTIRDQKRFLELDRAGGKFTVKSNHLKAESKLMEFNFFVINKMNGLGAYQSYRGACSPLTFASYLRSNFRSLAEQRRDSELLLVPDKRGAGILRRKIKRSLRPGLNFQQLIRQDSIKEVLKGYKKILAFEFDVVSLDEVSRFARPHSGLFRKVHEKIRFNADSAKSAIANCIADMFQSVTPNTARAAVINDDDEQISVRVIGMPQTFGVRDYDEIADIMNGLDLEGFATYELIEALRDTCTTEHAEIFMVDLDED